MMFGASASMKTAHVLPRAWWVVRAAEALDTKRPVPSLPADGAELSVTPISGLPRHWRAEGAEPATIPRMLVPSPLAATLSTGHNAEPPPVGSGWGAEDEQSALWGAEDGNRRWLHFQHPLGRNARGMFSMADYTIAAIPTLYRGRMYRSRLEARWAAFFDRLGWTHEYEPFDLGAWSPDFAITDPFDALIEIKPLTEPDPDLFDRIQGAALEAAVFVMRVAPVRHNEFVTLGWWAASHQRAGVFWKATLGKPGMQADLMSFTSDRKNWASATIGYGSVEKAPLTWGYADYTMGLWVDASNAVQWEPGR